jgi:hypothetical protein
MEEILSSYKIDTVILVCPSSNPEAISCARANDQSGTRASAVILSTALRLFDLVSSTSISDFIEGYPLR